MTGFLIPKESVENNHSKLVTNTWYKLCTLENFSKDKISIPLEVFESTVVSEYNLVCENKVISDILTAIFMSGLFVGVMIFGKGCQNFTWIYFYHWKWQSLIFGPMSDKIGRVNTIAVATVGLIAVQLGTAFLPTEWTV